jgi:L-aspartate oxidase
MLDEDPRGELAPRDAVSQAIVRQMAKTRHPCVYLDQSHLDSEKVRRRFPSIAAACEKCGLDFARDLIPVRPGAHYMVGGIATDAHGRTSVPGLWAAGEVAATGLHGANRLASNSLLEALVFGCRSGSGANALLGGGEVGRVYPLSNRIDEANGQELDLVDVRNALTSLMFRDVGIERTAASLESARESVDFWCQYVLNREFHDHAGWELQNMLTAAGLIVQSALARTESRGTHYRADFPTTDDDVWRVHLVAVRDAPGLIRESADSTHVQSDR